MIRNLEPDELAWFMRQALAFVGHPDPGGLSLRVNSQLRDAVADAAHCLVAAPSAGAPTAGLYVVKKGGGYAALELEFRSAWHHDDPGALRALVDGLVEREGAEAATLVLHLHGAERARELAALLAPSGFVRDDLRRLRFELTDVPPLGRPLVLEAWQPDTEGAFRELHRDCEGAEVSDAGWSYLKRGGGPFQPDLWFAAREALDRPTVGYAFASSATREIDSIYQLTGVGVRQRYRGDSEMLRRLVVTTLQELSFRSPVGAVDTVLGSADPKLIAIMRSLGFVTVEETPALVMRPR